MGAEQSAEGKGGLASGKWAVALPGLDTSAKLFAMCVCVCVCGCVCARAHACFCVCVCVYACATTTNCSMRALLPSAPFTRPLNLLTLRAWICMCAWRDARGSPCHRCLMVSPSRSTAPPRAEILKLKAAKSGGWLSEEEFDTEVKRLIREHNGEVVSLVSILDARTCCYPPSVWMQMHGLARA